MWILAESVAGRSLTAVWVQADIVAQQNALSRANKRLAVDYERVIVCNRFIRDTTACSVQNVECRTMDDTLPDLTGNFYKQLWRAETISSVMCSILS